MTVQCSMQRTCASTHVSQCGSKSRMAVDVQWPKQLNASLEEVDPELHDIIEKEKNRQYKVRARLRV
jgi:hypothetical protein